MDLNMQNNGKVFSKRYKEAQLRASISERRATDEERAWTGITKTDGQKIDPDMYRVVVDPPGSRYVNGVLVDVREASPYRKDGSVKQR